MAGLSHSNGAPLCILYHEKEGFSDINKQGGVVTFNLLRMDGSIVGYSEVQRGRLHAVITVVSGIAYKAWWKKIHVLLSS